jgi:pyruvate/2-oxoglutarate dehydrogenase complex dihydrolipoamide dehydrogenase (E3) component
MKILSKISVDYDLVVIGMSAYAHKLVSIAVHRGARVGWIWDQGNDPYVNIAQIHHILQLLKNKIRDHPKSARLKSFAKQIFPILNDFHEAEILEIMQKIGVDVIVGECKFQGKLQNSHILEVSETSQASRGFSKRRLSSRAYAITHDHPTLLRKIFGLAEHNYLTVNQLLHLEHLPNSIAVLGSDSHACAIAQTLNFLGVHTRLITDHNHVLPNVDVAIARTLQAQLEAEGIEIYTRTQVTAVSKIENHRSKIWIDKQTIECDRLLIPLAPSEFSFPSDRHIYECRNDQDIAKIVRQTLQTSFWRSPSITTQPSITFVPTSPPLAQIGMTEIVAKQKYGQSLYIFDSYVENGLCKIICDRHGQILGASMIGDRAKLVIEAIAIAMQGKVKIQNIAVLQELGINTQWENRDRDHAQLVKLKDWFTFRRDWNF